MTTTELLTRLELDVDRVRSVVHAGLKRFADEAASPRLCDETLLHVPMDWNDCTEDEHRLKFADGLGKEIVIK
jgi:hypothetical protein